MGIIGQSIPVRDAAMKVTGQFKYTADLEFPGMLHAKILFSPVPHARIKQALIDAGAVQCGYCTPGMVMSAKALLDRIENPTEEEIRNNGISNNLCRCTGYVKIVEAIRLAARRMMEAKAGGKKEES